jgi:hypothetical protein
MPLLAAAAATAMGSLMMMSAPVHAVPSTASAPMPGTLRTAADCEVDGGKLYCGNEHGAALHEHRDSSSRIVDFLETTYSVFACWGYGEWREGSNVWYWTNGDWYGRWGNVHASLVYTSQDPPAGMKQC